MHGEIAGMAKAAAASAHQHERLINGMARPGAKKRSSVYHNACGMCDERRKRISNNASGMQRAAISNIVASAAAAARHV